MQIDKIDMQIQRFKYVWEPFPHLKCENGSECGIGMDCPVLTDKRLNWFGNGKKS